jgi:hypothetical protein
MKSVCAYLRFDQELSICAGKNKRTFHIELPVYNITVTKYQLLCCSKTIYLFVCCVTLFLELTIAS